MPRLDATTVLLRPADISPPADLWDGSLRIADPPVPERRGSAPARHAHWLIPVLVTAGITGAGLAGPGLWTDELATWGMSVTPWPEFWPVLRWVDAVLAPYYALMHVWVGFAGDSDTALRLPSLLAMTAAAGVVSALGARVQGTRTGLISGLVFAILPVTSRFAAEARPYALTVLAAAIATYLLVRACEQRTARRWIAYGLAVAVLGLLHIVAVLLVAGHAWVVLAWHRQAWRRFGLAAGLGAAAVAPLLWYGVRQRNQVAHIAPIGSQSLEQLVTVLFGGGLLALLIAVLAAFGLPLRHPSAVWAAWAVVPLGALVVVSLAMPMFLPRYLVFTVGGWALLAGAALGRLRLSRSFPILIAIGLLGLPAQLSARQGGGHEQATAALGAIITAETRPGDGVIYADDEPIGTWTARDAVAHYVPAAVRPADLLATRPPRTGGLLAAMECRDIAGCLGGVPRLWLVRTGRLDDPLTGLGSAKEAAVRHDYRVVSLWYPDGLTLALLERASD